MNIPKIETIVPMSVAVSRSIKIRYWKNLGWRNCIAKTKIILLIYHHTQTTPRPFDCCNLHENVAKNQAILNIQISFEKISFFHGTDRFSSLFCVSLDCIISCLSSSEIKFENRNGRKSTKISEKGPSPANINRMSRNRRINSAHVMEDVPFQGQK